jgi:hypothetical protein
MISGGQGKSGRFTRSLLRSTLIGMLFCFIVMPAAGSSELTISAQQQLELADILSGKAEYDSAITEYRRFAHFFPDHPQVDYAGFQVALAYFMQRDFEKALPLFESICGAGVGNRHAVEACFMVSRCCMALGRQGPAEGVLKELAASTDDVDVRDRANYHMGWICLESGAVLNPPAINRAGEYFSRISDKNQGVYKVGVLRERLLGLEVDEQGPLRSQKNPKLAGVLAVFPGAGYVYCGRYHDALMSFLVTGGMAYAAYEAFDSDLEALGALIGLAGTGFYSGSIYGSVSAAHKYNRKVSRNFLQRLNDIRIHFTPLAGGNGAMASFHVPF